MIINNVKLVLENEVVHGSLEVQDGEIRAFAESQSRLPEAMDGEGGWLLPGLIELHTDNLDKFFTPRPKVDWPAHSAMSSHDALMVASGITTVLDAVAIGDVRDGGDRLVNLEKMINAIEETQKRGVNRAEHRLHLRCELPHHTTLPLFEKLVQRREREKTNLTNTFSSVASVPCLPGRPARRVWDNALSSLFAPHGTLLSRRRSNLV
ncbi:phosphonate metabolism protein [Shigella sonnei]|nr:phosphonate metabolism protein [Shigella sonnei]